MFDGLTPNDPAHGAILANTELPLGARKWGRILDVSDLKPGDLILTRSLKPDYISENIVRGQTKGGFDKRHSQWTHAAVYLGDGRHICEASFKELGFRSGVNIRTIQDYSDGSFAIRARRPANISDQQRISIAVGAMVSIGARYNFFELLHFIRKAYSGKGFWAAPGRRARINPKALVCSTLYQDAYNFSFNGTTVRMGSLCTPAHLSASPDFETVEPRLKWLNLI